METSIADYVKSDEFKANMKKVSAASRPFGNSTPSSKIYRALADATEKHQKDQS